MALRSGSFQLAIRFIAIAGILRNRRRLPEFAQQVRCASYPRLEREPGGFSGAEAQNRWL